MTKLWVLCFAFLIKTSSLFAFYPYLFDSPVGTLKEISTPHFRIIYSPSSEERAFEVASFVEEEFDDLTNYYGEHLLPRYIFNQKIRVVVTSDEQIANAFAATIIYPTIALYTSRPPSLSGSLSYNDPQYLRGFFRHELTHIITLTLRKYYDKHPLINFINYKVNANTIFSSRSFVEGSAIARESDGEYGRLKLPYTYHLMRRDLLDQNFPSFAEFGGAKTGFESGVYPYTYGALFLRYLSQEYPSIDKEYWDSVSRWKIASWAISDLTQQKQKVLWEDFQKSLLPTEEYRSNTNAMLSPRKKRINSFQRIQDKVYYFNTRNKEFRMLDLQTQKDKHILYGGASWEKVSLSPDENYLLVTGSAESKQYAVILHRASLISVSPVYEGLYEASFLPDSTTENFLFTAIDVNEPYSRLVMVSNKTILPLVQGSTEVYFSDPVAIDTQYIYFLHSSPTGTVLSRIDRTTRISSSLGQDTPNFISFLTGDSQGLSFSYADGEGNQFIKRASLQENTLTLINDNIKGEIFDSTIDEDVLYYRSSFSLQDNIMHIPLDQLSLTTRTVTFAPYTFPPVEDYTYNGTITSYQQGPDLVPMYWVPFINLQKVGMMALIHDSVGANMISIGMNVEYQKGTPEFSFAWNNEELPVIFDLSFNNLYLPQHSTLQIGQHHLLSTGFNALYRKALRQSQGSIQLSMGLFWQGRLTGDPALHPYQWSDLTSQQLIGRYSFRWNYHVFEGSYGFYRQVALTFEHRMDYLHTEWYQFAGKISLSPPILPLKIDFYAVYDTSSLSVYGSSLLGTSLIPEYHEYSDYSFFSTLVFFGQADLMLYSWEIQNGFGFGEFFIHRWAFHTGYRAGYWKDQNLLLHSIYLNTRFDFSFLFGYIPLSFIAEGNYAFTTKEWGYNLFFNMSLPF